MSDTIPTLPGSIPGLLRRGSPVLFGALPGVVVRTGRLAVAWLTGDPHVDQLVQADGVALDLSDATGRAHAAWYVAAHVDDYHGLDDVLGEGHYTAIVNADNGGDMDDEEIAALRRVCLHVAGLEAP